MRFIIHEDWNGILIEISEIEGGFQHAESIRASLEVEGNEAVQSHIMFLEGDGTQKTRVVALGYAPEEVYGALHRALYLESKRKYPLAETHAINTGLVVKMREEYKPEG